MRARNVTLKQVQKFEQHFGKRMRITAKLCRFIAKLLATHTKEGRLNEFDYNWAAEHLLSQATRVDSRKK